MDYRLDEPFNPDNEAAPERDGVECSVCEHFISDDTDDAQQLRGVWYCPDCFDALPEIVALAQSDSAYDGSKD